MNMKVLVVDDEPNILLSLEFLMRKNGFQVFIARNGLEALQLIETHRPQVILLDIMMPDMDGYEVCKYVREKEQLKATKIIFLSAKSKENDIAKGLAAGADKYLTKPFSTRQLVAEVKELTATV
jgi:DNA-binding response OmpR family regulator